MTEPSFTVSVTQTGNTTLDRYLNTILEYVPPDVVLFLNQTLYRAPYIIINYWSFVHLGAGILFYLYLPGRLRVWLQLNLAFEFIELYLASGGHPLFVEELVDIVWDILLSLGGYVLAGRFFTGRFDFRLR